MACCGFGGYEGSARASRGAVERVKAADGGVMFGRSAVCGGRQRRCLAKTEGSVVVGERMSKDRWWGWGGRCHGWRPSRCLGEARRYGMIWANMTSPPCTSCGTSAICAATVAHVATHHALFAREKGFDVSNEAALWWWQTTKASDAARNLSTCVFSSKS
ncbi:hypothetical protein P154DRAFT_525184 [Amniculicola lignicola CBS 123094]|uniref:Uncharacterized protein n=1 Tax=Amniculicola lignicola CBS 123094 TaxID=1392246 RepID=A0A6A5WD07_9PLEO|nr:hypothetical protein P154DRAFT_525184 [Amniculicola lignicola CBS 123094]